MWRSLVARVVRDDEVAGSIPVTPTNVMTPDIEDICLQTRCCARSQGENPASRAGRYALTLVMCVQSLILPHIAQRRESATGCPPQAASCWQSV